MVARPSRRDVSRRLSHSDGHFAIQLRRSQVPLLTVGGPQKIRGELPGPRVTALPYDPRETVSDGCPFIDLQTDTCHIAERPVGQSLETPLLRFETGLTEDLRRVAQSAGV